LDSAKTLIGLLTGFGSKYDPSSVPAHSTDVGALDASNSLLQQYPRGGPYTALVAQETSPQTEAT